MQENEGFQEDIHYPNWIQNYYQRFSMATNNQNQYQTKIAATTTIENTTYIQF